MSFWAKIFGKSEEEMARDIEQTLQGQGRSGFFRGYDEAGRVVLRDVSDSDILGGTVDYSRDTLDVAPLPRSNTLNIKTRK